MKTEGRVSPSPTSFPEPLICFYFSMQTTYYERSAANRMQKRLFERRKKKHFVNQLCNFQIIFFKKKKNLYDRHTEKQLKQFSSYFPLEYRLPSHIAYFSFQHTRLIYVHLNCNCSKWGSPQACIIVPVYSIQPFSCLFSSSQKRIHVHARLVSIKPDARNHLTVEIFQWAIWKLSCPKSYGRSVRF